MTLPNFEGINYFKPTSSDQWGDPSKISRTLLLKLDQLRSRTSLPIHVTSGYRTQAKYGIVHSQHMLGKAVDVVCPGLPLSEFYNLAAQVGFTGLGIYPAWKWNDKMVGGLHLDVRDESIARWMGVPDAVTGEKYIGLTEENLRTYGVV